jgi:iron complex outermembrane receptor protein
MTMARIRLLACACGVLLSSSAFAAGESGSVLTPVELKGLSLEQLVDVRVTSVSKRPEPLSEAASAIQVVLGNDIRRAGVTSLPEALRLAPNLQVARANASQWAISSRGLNNVLANKLLVQIDGRTVYAPLYAGVFWDAQNVLLEDVERIEVVSGPGGALWGANAVNGVVNVITKDARDTHGVFAQVGAGTEVRKTGGVRWGGAIGSDAHLRVYGAGFERDDTIELDGSDAKDGWWLSQGGFRGDMGVGERTNLTVQGDYYVSEPNPDGTESVDARGGNGIVRVEHSLSDRSAVWASVYYDRTYRDFNNDFEERVATVDFDSQHRFAIGDRNEVIYGAGFRWMHHEIANLPLFGFFPGDDILRLYSAFLQGAVSFAGGRVKATVGAKFEHNHFTGAEWQPSARLGVVPRRGQLAWVAVSRAVRTPSRIDRDFIAYLAADVPLIQGSKDYDSEDVVAYEAGWRVQARETVTGSISVFHNEYDGLRSAEPGPPPVGFPITFDNGVQGWINGIELAGACQLTNHWKLRGGYTFMQKHLTTKPGSQDLNQATAESDDPEHQALLQSMANLPGGLSLDATIRWVDALPQPRVPSYVGLDARVAWTSASGIELAVVGQNLVEKEHREFAPSSPSPREIERGVLFTLSVRR